MVHDILRFVPRCIYQQFMRDLLDSLCGGPLTLTEIRGISFGKPSGRWLVENEEVVCTSQQDVRHSFLFAMVKELLDKDYINEAPFGVYAITNTGQRLYIEATTDFCDVRIGLRHRFMEL